MNGTLALSGGVISLISLGVAGWSLVLAHKARGDAREANAIAARAADAAVEQTQLARAAAGPTLTIQPRGGTTFRIFNSSVATARFFGYQVVIAEQHGPGVNQAATIYGKDHIPEQGQPLEVSVRADQFRSTLKTGDEGHLYCWYMDPQDERQTVMSEPFRIRVLEGGTVAFEPR